MDLKSLIAGFVLAPFLLIACEGMTPISGVEDDTPPVLKSCSPASGAVDQPLNARIYARFDDAMDVGSFTVGDFFLTGPDGVPVPVAGYTYSNDFNWSVCLIPDGDLAPNTNYQVTLKSGGIRNAIGLRFAGNHVWSFTTGTNYAYYDPEFTLEGLTNGQLVRGTIALHGRAVPKNLIQGMSYAINTTNGTRVWKTSGLEYNSSLGSYTLTLQTGVGLLAADGEYTIYLRLESRNGTSTTKSVRVTVDNTPPELVILSSPSGILHGTVSFSGTVKDVSGVKRMYYTVGTNISKNITGFETGDWSTSFNTVTEYFSLYSDTQTPIDILFMAEDYAGNVTVAGHGVTTGIEIVNWDRINNWLNVISRSDVRGGNFDMQGTETLSLIYSKGTMLVPYVYELGRGEVNFTSTTSVGHVGTTGSTYLYGVSSGPSVVHKYNNFENSVSTNGIYIFQIASRRTTWSQLYAFVVYSNGYKLYLTEPYGGIFGTLLKKVSDYSGFDSFADSHGLGVSVDGYVKNGFSQPVHLFGYYNTTQRKIRFRRLTWSGGVPSVLARDVDNIGGGASGPEVCDGSGGTSNYWQTRLRANDQTCQEIHIVYNNISISGGSQGPYHLKYSYSLDGGGLWSTPSVIKETFYDGSANQCYAPYLVVKNSVPYVSYRIKNTLYVSKLVNGKWCDQVVANDATGDSTRMEFYQDQLYLSYRTTTYVLKLLKLDKY